MLNIIVMKRQRNQDYRFQRRIKNKRPGTNFDLQHLIYLAGECLVLQGAVYNTLVTTVLQRSLILSQG